ncbi:hypothetical protein [Myxococcus stipitatus]|uniref:hypothetical protein n=1 Tax=Myxococcus stipitatus TaxID=83455 RepID=UPI0030D42E9A
MKKHFILVAALTMPFLAGASEESIAPEASSEALVSEDPSASARLVPALLPYCWDLDQKTCNGTGQTQNCTDGEWTDYVCTCRVYPVFPTGTKRIWDCPEVR